MEMRRENESVFLRAGLSQELFLRLSDFIYRESGIKMPLTKKTMLEARLQKRLRSMGLTSYDEYCSYLFSPEGIANELVHMIDVVTTNKTDFFREAQHFEYLIEHVLPGLVQSKGAGIRRPFMAWSAACSSGEEPYTLAMVLDQFSRRARGFTFQVLGTDISTRVLETARDGIYHEERIEQIPLELRSSYFMKSRDRSRKLVRVVPELRAHVKFRRLNFMEEDFGMREKMDVVFCRNVLIYFDRPTQEAVINRICGHLHSGGYLFTGHSETINGMKVPLTPVANTVSRRI
ncbi:MAG TPA: protein-glutamate O-methyltransferase [Deltaproteobacteria bacterium]|nr:protein-glutamate O-methyltransferase [Deltaproteobacteria bacterium]HRT44674.1 protein-glutamate O-methyltransferase [Desulfomonilia bacterium]